MNSFESIMNCLNGKEQENIPYSLTISLYGARHNKTKLIEYYTDPNIYFENQVINKQRYDSDVIFSPFVLPYEAVAFGSKIKYFDNQPPNIVKLAIKTKDQIYGLKVPKIREDENLKYILRSTELLSKKYEGDTPVAAICTTPFDLPAIVCGIDFWLEMILFQEEEYNHMIELSCQFFLEWVKNLKESGASFIVLPSMFMNPKICTKKMIKEKMIPKLKEIYSMVELPLILHHGGNVIEPFIDFYEELPNIAGYVIDSRDNFEKVREKTEKLLIGNIDGPTMYYMSEEKLAEKIKGIVDFARKDKKTMIGTSGADILLEVDESKLQLFKRLS